MSEVYNKTRTKFLVVSLMENSNSRKKSLKKII